MSADTPSIYREYFQRTNEYSAKYGSRSIVLMQVGAFYEVYGLKSPNSKQHTHSNIDDFSRICNLSVSDKKILFDSGTIAKNSGCDSDGTRGTSDVSLKMNVVMAGFRDYTLDKYITKLTESGYTVAVFVQETDTVANKPVIKRVLHTIYSPGTTVSYDTETSTQITNNIMCVWFETYMPVLHKSVTSRVVEKSRETIVIGIAIANIFTGKTSIFEHQTPFYITPTTFDELERYVSVYSPSEIIVLSPFDSPMVDRILLFSGVQTTTIHTLDTRDILNDRIQNCTKQQYIRHILSTFYGEESYDTCAELHTYQIATQAFCYLMNFIQEHNPNLVRNMEIPVFNNLSTRMLLANHTLKQLNIIEDHESRSAGQYSSVSKFLNKCSTSIGRRQFYTQLVNPVFDTDWLNREYGMIEYMIDPPQYDMVEFLRKTLHSICDIEKLMRQLMVQKVHPASLYKLWTSIRTVQQLNMCIVDRPELCDYLCNSVRHKPAENTSHDYIDRITNQLTAHLERVLVMDLCDGVQGFDVNMIRQGVSPLLDNTVQKYTESMEWYNEIRESLNDMARSACGASNGSKPISRFGEKTADLDYVKIH